jgi:hypothetical protein
MTYNIINWNNAARRASGILEFLPLSCTPHNEPCTSAGQNEDDQVKECTALINQLIREQGKPPEGADFFIIINTGHEFGIYYETGIFYNMLTEAEMWEAEADETPAQLYANKCEMNIPEQWDELALIELRNSGHTKYQPAKIIKMKVA